MFCTPIAPPIAHAEYGMVGKISKVDKVSKAGKVQYVR